MRIKKTVEHIPEVKKKTIKELSDLIKSKKTILLASIKNLPASQFQEIGKKLRKIAVVKVPKKNMFFRAIDSVKEKELEKLKDEVKDSVAILFSDLGSYELAAELIRNKSPAKAKPGQIAPFDIEIPEGPTELTPGPAISELGALGIQIQIENGKITIKKAKIIAKQGDKISSNASDMMSKLDIKPFSIGFIPLVAYDTKEKRLYVEIKIDREGTLNELKKAYAKTFPFAAGIGYITQETIRIMIGKASAEEKRLIKVISGEPEELAEEKTDAPTEQAKEEKKPEDATAGLAGLFG
jgi:large subunit ribosomal protein L10